MKQAKTLHMRRRRAATPRQMGFSLVELMVALVLGLIVIGGVISIFLTNQQAFRTTESLSRLQENARISFELMAREIRQAGGNPCGTRFVSNVLNANDWSTDWDAGTIIGFESGTDATFRPTGTAVAQRVGGTDAIQVMGSAVGFSAGIAAHDAAAAQITLTASNASLAGATVMLCDNTSAAIAQVSSVAGTNTIAFDTTANCTTSFGFPPNCATPLTKTFSPGGYVSPLSTSFWYVGNNSRGGRSLYRESRGAGPEEIAEGVVDMQIQYLRGTSTGPGVFTPENDWVDATPADDWTAAAVAQVVALRFTLTLETLNRVGTDQQPIQRDLIYVVNLRNRLE
ncbi:prepilin-type N-terminal cleavage/methylation domain-containing protein [Hydrogenophaga sp.]|uniref:prepilin-type N-terminal cleavage/methylation domain-containing protein n=1 Tax=Hydrogenophaga sp. TaxID=1904254 RepID=UPI0025B7C28C|nr:prepilin-type N-terminal cleavage/methylation domain-containing protein [Hydrogenophaga sp.]